jgi:peptidoglycan/LPS O-acetylase OafA/YrhL
MTDQFMNAQGTADTADRVHDAPVPAATAPEETAEPAHEEVVVPATSTETIREAEAAPVETADTTKMPRLPSLIGLRGVGALTVVISHCINTSPGLVHPHLWSVGWWFSYTPVNLLWDGDEAVLMFFVLSGFVLARPFTRREQSQSYLAYYPRRLLRLYPPLWGGLIFTFLLTLVESRHIIPAATYWVNNHSNFHPSTLQDAVLPRVGTTFDGPLWSLRWEIIFSLSLPAYILIARAFKRWGVARVMVVLGVLLLGAADVKVHSAQISDAILYLPMFGVGVIIAFYETDLVRWVGSFMGRSGWNRVALFVIVVLFGDFTDEISPVKGHIPGVIVTLAHGLGVVAAALIILMVISWRPYAKALETRPIDWLGKRSFSLYLIHDSILITIVLWLGGTPNPFLVVALVLPTCLLGITLFYRVVEYPSHILSTNSGRAVQRWVNQRRGRKVQTTA